MSQVSGTDPAKRQHPDETGPVLARLPEDWGRALAVVAHPDDLEYGASAAIARWTAMGKDVRYLLATRGEAGIDSMAPSQAGPLRTAEQVGCRGRRGRFSGRVPGPRRWAGRQRGRAATGPGRGHPPPPARSDHRVELTATGGGDSGPWNHVDHRELGRALPDAVRDAANRWLFTDAGEPWSGVSWIAYASSPAPTHGVDVTDHIAEAVASLCCHRNLHPEPRRPVLQSRFVPARQLPTGRRDAGRAVRSHLRADPHVIIRQRIP